MHYSISFTKPTFYIGTYHLNKFIVIRETGSIATLWAKKKLNLSNNCLYVKKKSSRLMSAAPPTLIYLYATLPFHQPQPIYYSLLDIDQV